MKITNNTPFEHFWIAGPGPENKNYISVIVKGTYDLIHNQVCQIASQQLPIFLTDQHYGDSDKTSAKFESDVITYKPKVDIVLLANAYTPDSEIREFEVSLTINESIEKKIMVFGDRKWKKSGQNYEPPVEPEKIEHPIALIFENAFGGPDFDKNPVGKGTIVSEIAPLPNLENPDNLIQNQDTKPNPWCFAWYGKSWETRLNKTGTFIKGIKTLPNDFDWEFNNGALPNTLILPYLKGDETIELECCDPTGYFRFILPAMTPRVTMGFGEEIEELTMNLDTVCIIMESNLEMETGDSQQIEKQIYLVWRGIQLIDDDHKINMIKQILIE